MPASVHTRPDHDETLIARLAADDLSGSETVEVQQLVASCPACAELAVDLHSIMAATATLPAPRRRRDFQLTEADAARLRGTGWRRLLGRFGDPRLAFTRPLATGLVTLGIAGLVLAAAPSFLTTISFGTAGAAPALSEVGGASAAEASGLPQTDYGAKSAATPSGGPGVVSGSASFAPASTRPEGPSAAGSPTATRVTPPPAASVAPSDVSLGAASAVPATDQLPPDNVPGAKTVTGPAPSSAPSLLLVISVALLVVGIGLFLLRWVARRPT